MATKMACKDANQCTADTCDKAKGCVFPNVKDGSTCDTGTPCVVGDMCMAGKCTLGKAGEVWQATWDSGGKGRDRANAVVRTKSGALIAVGRAEVKPVSSGGDADGAIVVYDEFGNSNGATTVGSKGSHESLEAVTLTGSGVLAVGSSVSSGGDSDGWLVRFNSDGSGAKQSTLGGNGFQAFHGVLSAGSAGSVMVGSTGKDAKVTGGWLVKYDGLGNKDWEQTWAATTAANRLEDVAVSADGAAYVSAGRVLDASLLWQGHLVSVGAKGGKRWQRRLGGAGNERLHAIARTKSGYVLAGETSSSGTAAPDGWLAIAAQQWPKGAAKDKSKRDLRVLRADRWGNVAACSSECAAMTTCPAGDVCAGSRCDATKGSCTAPGLPDGLACDDGDKCWLNRVCKSGKCDGGANTFFTAPTSGATYPGPVYNHMSDVVRAPDGTYGVFGFTRLSNGGADKGLVVHLSKLGEQSDKTVGWHLDLGGGLGSKPVGLRGGTATADGYVACGYGWHSGNKRNQAQVWFFDRSMKKVAAGTSGSVPSAKGSSEVGAATWLPGTNRVILVGSAYDPGPKYYPLIWSVQRAASNVSTDYLGLPHGLVDGQFRGVVALSKGDIVVVGWERSGGAKHGLWRRFTDVAAATFKSGPKKLYAASSKTNPRAELLDVAANKTLVLAAGHKTVSQPQGQAAWLHATDHNGVQLWERTFGVPGAAHAVLMEVEVSAEGSVFAVGSAGKAAGNPAGVLLLARTNAEGHIAFVNKLSAPTTGHVAFADGLALADDGGLLVGAHTGTLTSGGGFAQVGQKLWLFRTDGYGNKGCNKGCLTTPAKPCDDSNPCTVDSCDTKTGKCKHAIGNGGLPCADDSDGTATKFCTQGQCK